MKIVDIKSLTWYDISINVEYLYLLMGEIAMSNEEFQKTVLERLSGIQTDISGMKSDIKELQSDVSGMKSDIKELQSDVSGMKSDIKGLQTDVSGLKSDVMELRTDVKELKEKVNAIYDQTAVLTEFRTETNLKLDNIIEDNKSIHEILGEHEVAIRTLQRKPV